MSAPEILPPDKVPVVKGKWGGWRPNSGRKGGDGFKHDYRSRRKARMIMEDEGNTPLDVMVTNMLHYRDLADQLQVDLNELLITLRSSNSDEMPELLREFLDLMKKIINARDKAQACAVDAAPYVHPRLQSIALNTNLGKEAMHLVSRMMSVRDAADAYASTLVPEQKSESVNADK